MEEPIEENKGFQKYADKTPVFPTENVRARIAAVLDKLQSLRPGKSVYIGGGRLEWEVARAATTTHTCFRRGRIVRDFAMEFDVGRRALYFTLSKDEKGNPSAKVYMV